MRIIATSSIKSNPGCWHERQNKTSIPSYLIIDMYTISRHRSLHIRQCIRCNLMAESARAGVYHDTHLTNEFDTHLRGGILVVNLFDDLNLTIARTREQ